MIRGVLLPIITPFDEKVRVDEQIMRQLIDFHIKAGVQGLFVLGSTGQGPAMTIEERKQTAAVALDQAQSRVPVIIHVGTADAGSAVELAEHAAAHKADAVAIVPPYYYSDNTEYEIIAHYKAVAKAVPLPIFIYENPKYSGISIPPGSAVRMKQQVPTLKGIKVAYGQGALLEYVRLLPDVSVFTGNADLFGLVPFGLAGMINPPTSFVPELCVELFKALDGQDYPRAVEAQKRVDTAARIVTTRLRKYGRVPLQEVFRMRGFAVKRFPKWETEQMPKDEVMKLERDLREVGILGQ
ncbi:MAG TPA: dihydrodipicolinate synthase family protein [Candidatus Polarisedimenticolaceae bacterium]|nr:dihydrodipicolinate synthase family protein [Candidatus Polarisedimenticolaceae bacterium]